MAQEEFCKAPPFAFATLLTSDSFLPGVEALWKSLVAVRSEFPLLVLLSSDISRATKMRLKILQKDSGKKVEGGRYLDLLEVPAIPSPFPTRNEGWEKCGMTKLRLWEVGRFRHFQKLFYVDADCIFLRNVDHEFSRACPAFAPDVCPPDRLNAGVILLEPSEQEFGRLLCLLESEKATSYDGGDTGFLNCAFPDFYSWPSDRRLPFRLNAQRIVKWFTKDVPGYWQSVQPDILHFSSSPKPWAGGKRCELDELWWAAFSGSLPRWGGNAEEKREGA